MANLMALQEVQHSQDVTVYIYKVTLSGSYAAATRGSNIGEQLKPFAASNPNFLPNAFPGNKGFKRGYALQGPAGNGTSILPGADIFTWLVKLFASANTEVTPGAYNAAITGDQDFLVAFESDPNN
jgi:hypothetical protein